MKDFLLPLSPKQLRLGSIATVVEGAVGELVVRMTQSADNLVVRHTSINSYNVRLNGEYRGKSYGSLRAVKMAIRAMHKKNTQISFDYDKLPKIKEG